MLPFKIRSCSSSDIPFRVAIPKISHGISGDILTSLIHEAMIGCVTIIIGDLASLLGCSMQVGTGELWEQLSSGRNGW